MDMDTTDTPITSLQKQMLDDVFDAFSMLVGGTMVSLMHVTGGVTRYCASAVELFNLPGEYVPNGAMDWNDYLHPDDRNRYMDVMVALLEGRAQTYDITYRVRTKSGDYGIFRAVGAVLRGEDGKPSLIGGAMFNEGMANNVDPVTVLPNKSAYTDRLDACIAAGRRTVSLLVGINGFNEINQVHGYTYGNRVLLETALLLSEVVGDKGSVFRFTGSAFVILFETLDTDRVVAIYDMIRYRLQRGIEINGVRNILTINAGMITVFGSEQSSSAVCSCLQYAYEDSREYHHGDLVDFNGSINYDRQEALAMISTIRECVRDDCQGFELEYVPVIDAKTEAINGAEATLYWSNPAFGKVLPQDFLPVLERDFIFEEVGNFILQHGMSEGVRMLQTYPGYLLCLNVYRIQLESDFFIDNLDAILDETGFPASQLSLKLASDCRYIEKDRIRGIIDSLHERGIIVIIDGFGSGADSIVFLKDSPVDAVCLDPQFLLGIETNKRDRDILEHLTEMAATCVTHINTKGVDTQTTRDILRDYPVTTMQGSLFYDPLSFDELRQVLSATS